MITIYGYMYDATLHLPIDGELVPYTIGCMSSYHGGILEMLRISNAYYAALHIADSSNGYVSLPYIVTDPATGLTKSGIVTESDFVYDDNNILFWMIKYYDMLNERFGTPHTIRFCRDADPDKWYLELDYSTHGDDIILKTDNTTVRFGNLAARNANSNKSYIFDYANSIDGNNPTGETETFYLGTIVTGINFTVIKSAGSTHPDISVNDDSYISVTDTQLGSMYYKYYDPNERIITREIFHNKTNKIIYAGFEHLMAGNTEYASIIAMAPASMIDTEELYFNDIGVVKSGYSINVNFDYNGITWALTGGFTLNYILNNQPYYDGMNVANNHIINANGLTRDNAVINLLSLLHATYYSGMATERLDYYMYLTHNPRYDDTPHPPSEPDPDVDPTDIPPANEEPLPNPPNNPDPYYDPTSDPQNPDYDPVKDPTNPQYDPTVPTTPYRPTTNNPTIPIGGNPPTQTPQSTILTPETPPSYVTTNAMFTLYNPSGGDLTSIANFLWSPAWSIDTFKKIFANPLDCILGLMVLPFLNAPTDTKTMNVGNISTGISLHFFTQQFYDFNCGEIAIKEYYASYLDYAPYTKINIYLPYIGDQTLSTDEVMGKTLGVKYRFDLATGDCVAFVTVGGNVLYSFAGNCAARLPLSGNNWSGILPSITGAIAASGSMAAGVPALGAASALAVSTMKQSVNHTGSMSGSAGLMGIQTPYVIITRPRQALPMNQSTYTGYPSFITESLSALTGYTEIEAINLEHIPATDVEVDEIKKLLLEGVLL